MKIGKQNLLIICIFVLATYAGLIRSFGQLPTYVRLTNNFVAVADASIFQEQPDANYGNSNSLTVGISADGNSVTHMLLRFDLSSIPTNSIVTNVTLHLFQNGSPPVDNYYTIYTVAENWDEHEVTWNNRLTFTPWASAGGDLDFPTFGVETVPIPPGTEYTISNNVLGEGFGLADNVQGWINDPTSNFGWIFYDGGTTQFTSRENSTNRPTLTIDYLKQPLFLTVLPLAHTAGTLGFDMFSFSVNVAANHGYMIQANNDLTTTNWQIVGVLDPATKPQIATVQFPVLPGNRFFRVVTSNTNQ